MVALAVVLLNRLGDDTDLEVTIFKDAADINSIRIMNAGTEPVRILAIDINNRPECMPMNFVNVARSGEPIELKVGESFGSLVFCGVVRATIKTDRGAPTFSFR